MMLLSAEEQELGEITFVHKRLPAAEEKGYTALPAPSSTTADSASGDSPRKPSDLAESIVREAQPAPASDGLCRRLCRKAGSEVKSKIDGAIESWSTFLVELDGIRTALWSAIGGLVQWSLPCLAVAVSVACQAFAARLATLYYIRYMHRLEQITAGHKISGLPADPLGEDWIYSEHLDYPQKLQDLFASFVDPVSIPAFVWDLTMFPMTLVCLCLIIGCRDVYMWAKVCLCFTCLNLGRAICHVSTVVPDSQGWEACKERLTNFGARPDALEEMAQMTINWRTMAFGSISNLLQAEAKGMRYCGDMIYSGQTFVLLLFALGIFEVMRRNWPDLRKMRIFMAMIAFPFACAASIGTLLARYHYTIDIVLATVLTALWYDSSTVASACGWWSTLSASKQGRETKIFLPERKHTAKVSSFALAQQSFTYLLELVMIGAVMWDQHSMGHKDVLLIYATSLLMVSFVLSIFSLHLFNSDEDLQKLPICVRCPVALFLGLTHMTFLVTQVQSFKRGQLTDESFIIKIFKACLQSAPLACLQLYLLVTRFDRTETSDSTWAELDLAFHYGQMLCSFYSLGEAVALFDGMRSSVLFEMVRNQLWRTLLAGLRMAEVTSRISMLVLLLVFARSRGSSWKVIGGFVAVDWLISACLARYFGVARKFLAVVFFACVSLTSNIYLFQEDEDRRRLADVLCTLRISQFVFLAAGGMWYFKFYPGGMASVFSFVLVHKGVVLIAAISFFLYLIMLVMWLEIRRIHAPTEMDPKERDALED